MLSWIKGTATQGGADAFVQSSITTGLLNDDSTAWRVRCIEWFVPSLPGVDSNFQAALMRKSMNAMPAVTDWNALIREIAFSVDFTTSGLNYQNNFVRETFDRDLDLIIVEDPIYFCCDSNATAAANLFSVRIGVEPRKITTTEKLQLVAAALTQ